MCLRYGHFIAFRLAKINDKIKEQFIIIIDEWDCLFREDKNNENLQMEYMNLLRGLFKGTPSGAFLKLAYITGILPIKKYGTQSALILLVGINYQKKNKTHTCRIEKFAM